jgi:hypothetical protein
MSLSTHISARCNATLRDEVKAGLIKPCAPGACVVALIAGEAVVKKDWDEKLEEFGKAVIEFNTSRKALPHPGHIIRVNFCSQCGENVEKFHEGKDIFTNEMWSRIEAQSKK